MPPAASQFNLVSVYNPRGNPPPPRIYRNTGPTGDLMTDFETILRQGGPLTAGSLPIYGAGSGASAHEALSQGINMGMELVKTLLSFVPGVNIGLAIIDLSKALAEGNDEAVLMAALGVVARMSPCGQVAVIRGIIRAAGITRAAISVYKAHQSFNSGDALSGAMNLAAAGADIMGLFRACFAGDTKLLTKDGYKRIDEFKVGDKLLSRSEFELDGPIEEKEVVEVFVRVAPIMNLHVGGKLIRTTAEHPFYVLGKGWIPTGMLEIGDLLVSHDGQMLPVEGVAWSGEVTTVYNLCVANYHTYFVGQAEWGFSVWSHNKYTLKQVRNVKGTNKVRGDAFRDWLADRSGGKKEIYFKSKVGKRFHDVGKVKNNKGQNVRMEAKNYKQYLTIDGKVTKRQVPLSKEISRQIKADKEWVSRGKNRTMEWHFVGARPSKDLRVALNKAGINIVYHRVR